MGLAFIGKLANGYNKVNDTIGAEKAHIGTHDEANNFLDNWIKVKLPEAITGLASTIVDDGSAAITQSALDVGTKESNIFGSIFK